MHHTAEANLVVPEYAGEDASYHEIRASDRRLEAIGRWRLLRSTSKVLAGIDAMAEAPARLLPAAPARGADG